ncbi:MAG TPA: TIGR03668 family PPOX class F420-dependent oxidoreductase [Baekduia sp.]|uniref:TIGR03668 family PPOX class F420-dependent oxidoreductase n=1 Tax=Baekduia sp. TaxID=2600305 RepID=UPI002D7706AA|nr:TIGR03668 family PPOX class F420-dependent oxidoreductase [Baekduia sp.]HET6507406.1 TIGR03668 family PPOX class F420-dependent oxidoreductase [Baekduia sp.]
MSAGGDARAWERLAAARVARFATTAPRIVPVTFVVSDGAVFHAVDHKPKSTRALARLEDLRRDPRASLLVDQYDEDWSALWWVRADGRAAILAGDDPRAAPALDLLVEKYPQYADRRPEGPVIALDVERIASWSAAGPE